MKAIIYDLEIKKAILNRSQSPEPDVVYCEGWHDHQNMGISVLCAFDFEQKLPVVFCEDNLAEFQKAVDATDYLVSFNGINFDNKVLSANGINIPESKSVDLLHEIWRGVGLSPFRFNPRTHGGYGLDAVCAVNFNLNKTGDGASAPAYWQRGRIGHVISYCLSDVHLTTRLFEQMLEGEIVNPKTGTRLKIDLSRLYEKAAAQAAD